MVQLEEGLKGVTLSVKEGRVGRDSPAVDWSIDKLGWMKVFEEVPKRLDRGC